MKIFSTLPSIVFLFISGFIHAQTDKELWTAVYKKDATKVNALLVRGQDPNVKDSSGVTPLIWATKNENLPLVRVLLHHKAYPYIPDVSGWTAFHWASLKNANTEILKVFLKYASYPLVKTKSGKTVVQVADSAGASEIVTLLQQNLNLAFNQAVTDADVEKIKEFIQAGANVNNNQHGSIQQSPLHAAVWINHPEIVKLLIEKGANVNIQDRNGNTPLHLAAMQGDTHIEVIRLLLERGAKQMNNKLNMSPVQIARRLEHTQTSELLKPE
jgi:ankyrin repeat protein